MKDSSKTIRNIGIGLVVTACVVLAGSFLLSDGAAGRYPPRKSWATRSIGTTKNGFVYGICDYGLVIMDYVGSEISITLPTKIWFRKVDGINADAFSDNATLVEVTIPASYMSYFNGNFNRCSALRKVRFENSELGAYTRSFSDCPLLEELDFAEQPSRIGNPTQGTPIFINCPSLKSVTIPQSVEEICGDIFSDCASLREVVLPVGLRHMGATAFDRTPFKENLTDGMAIQDGVVVAAWNLPSQLAVPEGVTGITVPLPGVTEVTLPSTLRLVEMATATQNEYEITPMLPDATHAILQEGMVRLPNNTFAECKNLKTVQVPASLRILSEHSLQGTSLDDLSAFMGVTKVESDVWRGARIGGSFVIPATMELVGMSHFFSARVLESVIFEGEAKELPAWFLTFSPVKEVQLPRGLESIGRAAFAGCKNIGTLVIPDTVTFVDRMAFEDMDSLKLLTIPASVLAEGFRLVNTGASRNPLVTRSEGDMFCGTTPNEIIITVTQEEVRQEKDYRQALYMLGLSNHETVKITLQ